MEPVPNLDPFLVSLQTAYDRRPTPVAACSDAFAVVQVAYRALAAGNPTAFLEVLHEEVELEIEPSSKMPFSGRCRGRRRTAEAVAANFAMVADQVVQVKSVEAVGEMVVVRAREQGRFTADGRSYDIDWFQTFTVRDGKIFRFHERCEPATTG
ncbi:MAG: nuclear transport factor 2 family protein [Planctomycetia bacterium]